MSNLTSNLHASRATADAIANRTGFMIAKPDAPEVVAMNNGMAKTLKSLMFYAVGEDCRAFREDGKGYGITRNKRPINSRKDAARFEYERKFIKSVCDPIIEFINLVNDDERDGFITKMYFQAKGLVLGDRVAVDPDQHGRLREQWLNMVRIFQGITKMPSAQ